MISTRKKGKDGQQSAEFFLSSLGYKVEKRKRNDPFHLLLEIKGIKYAVFVFKGKYINLEMHRLTALLKTSYPPAFFILDEKNKFLLLTYQEV